MTSLNFLSSYDSNDTTRVQLMLPGGINGAAVVGGNLLVDAIKDSTATTCLSSCYDAACGGTRQLDVKSFRRAALVVR